MSKSTNEPRNYLVVKILVGLLGSALALVFHELFHVFMHWNQIRHINFFPNPGALIEVSVDLPTGYDLEGEEMGAYFVTFIVALITVMVIFKIHDATDQRTTGQILFPDDKEMQKMNPSKMLEQSGLGNTKLSRRKTR